MFLVSSPTRIPLFTRFYEAFVLPLSFLPPKFILFLTVVVAFFTVFVIGRIFKWLWDILPIV